MSLNNIAKLVRQSKNSSPEAHFLNELIRAIETGDVSYTPSPTYKPSSLGGCMRGMYYQIIQATPDNSVTDYCLVGMGDSGTMRHESLQTTIASMEKMGFDCKWVDVAEHLKAHNPENTIVVKKSGMETKCRNERYNLSFLCDGVIDYKGERYILEIKTESSFKYSKHDSPFPEHKVQAACYSLALGITKVIFLYENRDNCSKKTYLVDVTPEMRQAVIDKITTCNKHVKKKIAPPKSSKVKDCTYCGYKRQCRIDGDTDAI